MITGFNTDVEHGGITYHVQTEDKGLDTPLILSLVYVGGAILASKRSPYDDLISKGFDERELAERLGRQHKLICAAIRAGRIEDLKRMKEPREPAKEREPASKEPEPASKEREPVKERVPEIAPLVLESAQEALASVAPKKKLPKENRSAPVVEETSGEEINPTVPLLSEVKVKKSAPSAARGVKQSVRSILQDVVSDFARAEAASDDSLYLSLLDEKEFRGGEVVILKIRVARGHYGEEAIMGADVTVKVLGSTFRPMIFPTKTGTDGVAMVRATLPHFHTGRAAILVRAVAQGYEAELRRIIHQG